MMRHLIALASICLLAFPTFADESAVNGYLGGPKPYHLNPDRALLRVNGTFTRDVGRSDENGYGVELATGVPVYPLDTLAVFIGHMDTDNSDLTTLGFFAEETYRTGLPIMPYAAAGFGYTWLQQKGEPSDGPDVDSFTAEVEGGVKFRPCSYATVHAGVEYDWAEMEVFPAGNNDVENKQWRVVVGVTWLY